MAEVTFYDYLKLLVAKVTNELVFTCVGGVGREWEDLRPSDGNLHQTYMAGTSPMALGMALALPHRRIISIDTDGSILMGLSILPAIAKQNPSNLLVVVCDNGCYEAAGGIPTFTASVANLAGIARESGIKNATQVEDPTEFQKAIDEAYKAKGASFIVVKVKTPHPPVAYYNICSAENKFRFVRYVEKTENIHIYRLPLIKL